MQPRTYGIQTPTRLTLTASLLVYVASATAAAHVDYVAEGDPGGNVAELVSTVVSEPSNVLLLIAGVVGAGAAALFYLRYAGRLTDVRVGVRTLRSYRPYLPWMLRLSLGLPLVGAGFSGYYFSPSVPTEARLLQVFIGFMLLFGLATRLVAAAGLVAYAAGLAAAFPTLLLAGEYVPGFLGIVALGPGQPSADMLLRRVVMTDGTVLSRLRDLPTPGALLNRAGVTHTIAPTLVRAGVGLNFAYLGVTQKWLNPGPALEVVARYDLTSVVPVSPELWVFGAGLVELGVGLLFVAGCFTRGAAVAAFVLLTTTLFGLPTDPVLAHTTLFGLVSALMVTGSGPYALDRDLVPRLHRRLAVSAEPRDVVSASD